MRHRNAAHRIQAIATFLLLALFLGGCQKLTLRKQVSLGEIYNDLAQLPDTERNPVIVIPGILGSRLTDSQTGEIAWGESGLGGASPLKTRSLTELALPMQQGVALHQLHDQVQPDGPLDQFVFRVAGIPLKVNAYAQILETLGVGGYRDRHFHGESRFNEVDYGDEHFTCFQYSYDWRRDVSESAARFAQYIDQVDAYTRQKYLERYGIENPHLKYDIVAHSMGGLVARYFLRYGNQPLPDDGSMPVLTWAGAEKIGRVFLVATPNLGSTQAISELKEGMRLIPPLPKFPPAVIGTMPSVYQLLPRKRDMPVVFCERERVPNMFSPHIWKFLEWGLADPKQDKVLKQLMPYCSPDQRRQIALDHQAKCLARAEQFHRSLDFPADLPPCLEMHLFAGDAKRTLHQLCIDPASRKITNRIKTPGDGTVTRTSTLSERKATNHGGVTRMIPWTNETFLSTNHLGLTRDRTFVDNVLDQLLARPRAYTPE